MNFQKTNKKRIAIDLSAAQPQISTKVNGGGEYGVFMFDRLCQENIDIVVFLDGKKGDNSTINAICSEHEVQKLIFNSISELSNLINTGGYDTVFFPICHPKYSDLKIDNSQRIIGGIHDLSTIEQAVVYRKVYGKKFFAPDGKDWMRRIIRCVDSDGYKKKAIESHRKIFHISENQVTYTVSHSTRAEIQYYFPEMRTTHIPVFYTPETFVTREITLDEEAMLKEYDVQDDRYFLLCSANRWNKNNALAIKALDSFFVDESCKGYKAVVLGAVGESEKYLESLPAHSKQFIFKGYVDRMEMDILFKHAHAFVYPSVIEGFGLPPIEAMRYGTLSLCSISTSITEICADAAIYFDPYSQSSMEKAFIKSFDEEYAAMIRNNIKRRYTELQEKRKKDIHGLVSLILGKQ